MVLEVKTLSGVIQHKDSPNGGWGWVVLVASFCVLANAFGTSKSLGIYYLDMKLEFDANNSNTAAISSLFLGALGLAGFLNTFLSRWLNARMIIMIGGLLACIGLLICVFSPALLLVYIGCFMTGIGHGLAFVSCTSQISLYFGSLRPLANGIMLSGSSVGATVMPYLNNYLLKVYGWRGSFFILAGVSLQTCVLGALIQPIKVVSSSMADTAHEISTVARPIEKDESAGAAEEHFLKGIGDFFKKYWVAICLLLANVIACLAAYAPNIYLVPYAKALGYTYDEATLLLSLISVGDVVCRPLCGVLITHSKLVSRNLMCFIALVTFLMAMNHLIAVFGAKFSILIAYVVLHGCFFGLFSTACVTAVPTLMGTKNIIRFYGLFFPAGSFSILASGPIAGSLVDQFGSYQVVYWYSFFCLGATALIALLMHVIIKVRGGVVLDPSSPKYAAKA